MKQHARWSGCSAHNEMHARSHRFRAQGSELEGNSALMKVPKGGWKRCYRLLKEGRTAVGACVGDRFPNQPGSAGWLGVRGCGSGQRQRRSRRPAQQMPRAWHGGAVAFSRAPPLLSWLKRLSSAQLSSAQLSSAQLRSDQLQISRTYRPCRVISASCSAASASAVGREEDWAAMKRKHARHVSACPARGGCSSTSSSTPQHTHSLFGTHGAHQQATAAPT